jgi:capsular exopolysaccharide synthesis family protein
MNIENAVMERLIKVAEPNPNIGIVHDKDTSPPARPGHDLKIVYTQTRTVNVAPEVFERNRVIAGLNDAAVNGAYKMLRTQVLQRMRAHGWSTLVVTSPAAGEGKTLTAVNLAISLAKEVNHTVLLVDLDLRRPSVARYFGYAPVLGLREHLLDEVPLTDIMFTPGIDRLAVLPGGGPLAESSELLTAPKMVRLARELKDRYARRVVIYDMPPLLLADDVLAFAPHLDAVLLVVEEGRTRKDELRRATEMLKGINVVGTALNKAADTGGAYY